jgi:phage-related protein (TIGR01555 family)
MGRRRDHKPGGRAARTADGFDNFTARLGLGQDNALAASGYRRGNVLSRDRQALDAMYRTSWIVGRMVDVVAEDMLRGGIDIQTDLAPGKVDELLRALRRLGVNSALSRAIKWGRLYGGALALMLIDGADPSQPLSPADLQQGSFLGLHVLDRHQVVPSLEVVSSLGPKLGLPLSYTVNDSKGMAATSRWHHSRVIRFVGVDLPYYDRLAELGWGASVVERAYDRILALDSSTHGAANLMLRSYLRVVGVDGLREILAAGGQAEKALFKMFTMIRELQTNEGLTLLDAKDNSQTYNWTFAGVSEALQSFAEQIAGATGIPLVRLLGQSPKGFSTGEADLRSYYDTIATQQDDDLRPAYETLLPILSRSLWGEPLPAGTRFEFRDLWQVSETDKSTIATADAQSVAGLYAAGLVSESQALAELRITGRITGRWAGLSDEDIQAASAISAPAPSAEHEQLPGLAAPGDEPTPQEISLNGAQVASMVSIVQQVGAGQLPRDSGVQMLMASFTMTRGQAEEIMGDVGRGFTPSGAEADA